METLGALVGVSGFVALIGAIIVLVVPTAGFRARRPKAKVIAIVGAVAFCVGVAVTPDPDKKTTIAASSASASPSATPTAVATIDKAATAAATQDAYVAMYRRVLALAGPCDKAITVLGKTANAGDTYGAYRIARDGEEACRTASTGIDALEPPEGLTDEARDDTRKGLDICRGAYASRRVALGHAKEIADGNARPSLLVEMEDRMKDGQAGVMMCVAQLLTAGGKAGVAMDRLS